MKWGNVKELPPDNFRRFKKNPLTTEDKRTNKQLSN